MLGCATDLAAAAQVAAAAPGTDSDNLHAPPELEDEPGRWDLNSPTYQHARRQLEQQAETLGEGTARNLVVRGADVLSTSGAPHEVVAATHSYCVLALHHAPLASLACDPLLDGSKVLCPRCGSGECTKFESYLYDRMRRLPLPRGVLVLLDSQYVCNGCPNARPGCQHTWFTAYSLDVLDSIDKADPIRGRLLREALPYVPTRKGGVSKEMAYILHRSVEEGMEAAHQHERRWRAQLEGGRQAPDSDMHSPGPPSAYPGTESMAGFAAATMAWDAGKFAFKKLDAQYATNAVEALAQVGFPGGWTKDDSALTLSWAVQQPSSGEKVSEGELTFKNVSCPMAGTEHQHMQAARAGSVAAAGGIAAAAKAAGMSYDDLLGERAAITAAVAGLAELGLD